MLDANNRPLLVYDHVALADANMNIIGLVIKAFGDGGNGFVALDNGLVFHDFEVVSWGGYEWVICEGCGFSWPFDVRMNDMEECPDCEAPFRVS